MRNAVINRVRGLARKHTLAQDLAWRQLPRFAVRSTPNPRPCVYYLAPHVAGARGGVRVIYRHVDTLNEAGIDAAVVHALAGFRCTWFANSTRVLDAAHVVLAPNDVLVIPECYGPGLHGLPDGPRVVIFNQAAYHTFDLIPLESTGPGAPYVGARGVVGLLTVSHDGAALLRHAFPGLNVSVCRQVMDPRVFYPASAGPGRSIAFTTNRREPERHQLLHILRARGTLADWTLAPITNRTEAETAAIMRESAVFLSFLELDGFGLPPAEAMASGAYVVGYTGGGGRDFFNPAYCSPVADGDLLAYACAVEEACASYDRDRDAFVERGRAGAASILKQYSAEGLRDDLLDFYEPLVAG